MARPAAEPQYSEPAIHDATLSFLLAYQQGKSGQAKAGPEGSGATAGQDAAADLAVMDRTDSADALSIIEEMTEATEYQALRGIFPILTDAALEDFATRNAEPARLEFTGLSVAPRVRPIDYNAGVTGLRDGGWRGFKRSFPDVESVKALSRPGFDPEARLAILTVITRLHRERMVALFTLRWIEDRWQVLQVAPLAVIMYAKD